MTRHQSSYYHKNIWLDDCCDNNFYLNNSFLSKTHEVFACKSLEISM
jgi:hypothetical protein